MIEKIKHLFRVIIEDEEASDKFDALRHDEKLSPNVRAIRLAISVADTLVANGVAVSDVVSMGLDITERYCKRRVMFDISSTVIMASQDRGNEREPLTMIRHSVLQTPNSMLVHSVQELVRDISAGRLTLDQAEQRYDEIVRSPKKYPFWLVAIGGGLISAGVGIMFGASTTILTIMFILGTVVSYILRILAHQRVPAFFAQVFSSIFITLVAAVVAWAGNQSDLVFFHGLNPTLIVIGGIVMLVAGLAVVSAVQDAIDEYYMTANARLLRVIMMTIGIVAGVIIGLYISRSLGISIAVDPETGPLERERWQLLGPILLSVGYALSQQSRLMGVVIAGLIGLLSWWTYSASSEEFAIGGIVASGIAATVVSFVGTVISRFWRTPSYVLIMSGIVPLVPGLTLYNALMQIVNGMSDTGTFNEGALTLFTALMIALSVASGVSLGIFIGRPLRRTLVRARNALPRRSIEENI